MGLINRVPSNTHILLDAEVTVLGDKCGGPHRQARALRGDGRQLPRPVPRIQHHPALRTASGAILVAHRLPELTSHVSRDDDHTWDNGTTIDSGIGAGGRMLEVEPNVVLYPYYASWGALRAQFIRVTPSGLEPAYT